MIPVIDKRSSQRVVIVEHEQHDDPYFMRKVAATAPGIHENIVKAKKHMEQLLIIPRPIRRKLRKAYRSRNRKAINEVLAEAVVGGVTKEAIKHDFEIWKREKQFTESRK